jgi:cholesterol oxidase
VTAAARQADFDAVVVGSGFGGSVAAHRLAEAGLSVCLLERGKPYPPGDFPRVPREMARNFWDPSEGRHGMFDVWTFKGIEAIVGSGLGGGSLIYANVLLRKDENWFVNEEGEDWPVTRSDLEPHYDRVEQMLEPEPYPFEHEPYASTPKTRAMRDAAQRLGLDWQLPGLAVTFGNPGRRPVPGERIEDGANLHGRERYTCRLCGECDIGCNFGSKNTLDLTYLSAFAELPRAEIRTRAEVRRLARRDGAYEVGYIVHAPEREGERTKTSELPVTTVTAARVVLAAGALGSTYLLLRNAGSLPGLSTAALGTRFSGNGDLLGFVVRSVRREGGQIVGDPLDGSVGAVITSTIRYPDARDGGPGRGFYIQEGGFPQFAAWLVEMAGMPGRTKRSARFAFRRIANRLRHRPVSNVSGEVSELIGDCLTSSGGLPLLGMGRDVPDGVMSLRGKYLEVDWTTRTSRDYFEAVKAAMERLADGMGARFNDSPLWYFRRVVTVHPLGGCPMGGTPETGMVDPWGQVYGCPGLYVADGAVMPGPVGPNPSLTIAALADRFAERIAAEAVRGR